MPEQVEPTDQQMREDKDLQRSAMALVNAILERADVSVEKRQAVNDDCDQLVKRAFSRLQAEIERLKQELSAVREQNARLLNAEYFNPSKPWDQRLAVERKLHYQRVELARLNEQYSGCERMRQVWFKRADAAEAQVAAMRPVVEAAVIWSGRSTNESVWAESRLSKAVAEYEVSKRRKSTAGEPAERVTE